MMKMRAYAEGSATVGTQSRASGRAGESQSSFYRRSGTAFGQNITAVNGRSVRNMRTTGRR